MQTCLTWRLAYPSQAIVCYANGASVALYGQGGMRLSWLDQPSFDVLSRLVAGMHTQEEKLLSCMRLMLERHPAAVNAIDAKTGTSLLHILLNINSPALLKLALHCDCKLALHPETETIDVNFQTVYSLSPTRRRQTSTKLTSFTPTWFP